MDFLSHALLTALIVIPALAAGAIMALRRRSWTRWIALGATIAVFVLSLSFLVIYNWHSPPNGAAPTYACRDVIHPTGVVQFVERVNLIPAARLQYFVGIDGLSLPLILLIAFLSVRACVALWKPDRGPALNAANAVPISTVAILHSHRLALVLLLECTLLGTFLSLNFVLFVFFFAISILPVVTFLRTSNTGRNRRALFHFAGAMLLSITLLTLAMIGIYRRTGEFDLIALPALLRDRYSHAGPMFQHGKILFALLMAGLLIRLPVVPLHRWLSDLYADAPTPLGMMVSAALPATAAYGALRIACPLFPDAVRSLWMLFAIAGVIGVLYGALTLLAQHTFRRTIACFSVAQMGLVLLGIAIGTHATLNGAMFLLISHGLIAAALFALAGIMVKRAGNDELDRPAAASRAMPVFTGYTALVLLAAVGLPMLCGFVGELLVLCGTFQAATGPAASPTSVYCIAILGCTGTVLIPVALLWKFRRIVSGNRPTGDGVATDLTQREITLLTPMLAAIFLLGILPWPLYFAFTRTTLEAIFR
ncbi:MAG TPA: NADH-quinone oxidoreductase subunit M [Tepidisphaeraceae bacterium]|jgi:NADH-quinone oxidoreductase subunit M|nr:NADH-quinone oxidoreductase subunit M [Tepidisphaeraceae bacterium]